MLTALATGAAYAIGAILGVTALIVVLAATAFVVVLVVAR